MGKEKPHYYGHRKRLRDEFLKEGFDSLHDYEIVELPLTFSVPYKDMKPYAKKLVENFGSIKDIFDAPMSELKRVKNVKESTITLIKFIKEISILYQKQKMQEKTVPKAKEELVKYCIRKIGSLEDEQFRLISINSKLEITKDALISEGTIDKAPVYPRKVIETALENKSYGMILVHNHPNGKLLPSEKDKYLTEAINIPAKLLNIKLYDHLIVSSKDYYSFREEGLL